MKTKEELKLEYGAPRREAFASLEEYLEANFASKFEYLPEITIVAA